MSQTKTTPKGNRKSTKRATAKRADINQPTEQSAAPVADIDATRCARCATNYADVVNLDGYTSVEAVADRYAATLAHPNCPRELRRAFESIIEYALVGLVDDWADPRLVRTTLPSICEYLRAGRSVPGDVDGIIAALEALHIDYIKGMLAEEIAATTRSYTGT